MLQPAFHANLVGLVEAFHDDDVVYLAYNYNGLVVSLSQVIATPTVILGEPEIASICRGVLQGLEYLHERLKIGHGNVESCNVLLCPDGDVKIGKHYTYQVVNEALTSLANIGDAMLKEGHTSFLDDREKLRSLVFVLSRSRSQSGNTPTDQDLTSSLSKYGLHFVEQLGSASYSYLFEVRP